MKCKHKWKNTGYAYAHWCEWCGTLRVGRRSMKTNRLYYNYFKPKAPLVSLTPMGKLMAEIGANNLRTKSGKQYRLGASNAYWQVRHDFIVERNRVYRESKNQ